MRTGRPKAPIVLSKEEDEQLKSIANSRSLAHGLVNRAHIVLMAAQGTANHTIARMSGLNLKRFVNGANVIFRMDYRVCVMNYAQVDPINSDEEVNVLAANPFKLNLKMGAIDNRP
jgi:hypothetical protein